MKTVDYYKVATVSKPYRLKHRGLGVLFSKLRTGEKSSAISTDMLSLLIVSKQLTENV